MTSLTPLEITDKASEVGQQKTNNKTGKTIISSILAGMFIAFGAVFSITSISGLNGVVPFGIIKLISGVTFSLGLILVMIAGAELFTGNSLLIISKLDKKITTRQMCKNRILVRLGNFVGAGIVIALTYFSKRYTFGGNTIGETILNIGIQKVNYGFIQAICLGILCNILVCLGVRLARSGKRNSDKILGIIFPITAFVSAGFEHSIANMFYLPFAFILKNSQIVTQSMNTNVLTIKNILINNLLPVTIGNIIGGAIFVGLFYRIIYHKKNI